MTENDDIPAPPRSFTEAISVCLNNKFFTFSGRASRSEFWWFILFSQLVLLLATMVDMLMFGIDSEMSPLSSILGLGLFPAGFSAMVRRMHDTGRSGWWAGGIHLNAGVIILSLAGLNYTAGEASPEYLQSAGEYPTLQAVFSVVAIISFVAILAYSIILLVFLVKPGKKEPNR